MTVLTNNLPMTKELQRELKKLKLLTKLLKSSKIDSQPKLELPSDYSEQFDKNSFIKIVFYIYIYYIFYSYGNKIKK